MRGGSAGRAGAAVAMALLLGSPPARAQFDSREAITLQNEILDLRHQLQSVQRGAPPAYQDRSPGGGGAADQSLVAQLLDRVSTLEDQVRQLHGRVDELANQQQQQQADFTKQLGDLQFALQNGSGGRSSAPTLGGQPGASNQMAASSQAPSSLGASGVPSYAAPQSASPPPRTPELALQEANTALTRRDYPAAIAAAREVLARRGPRAVDAQFVLAEAEQGQHNYQQAAPDFYDAYNRARTGPRAPDALLGVANSLVALNDKPSACEALNKLRAEFPQARPDIRDAVAEARRRAACR